MVPGIGYAFKCFIGTLGVIEELKSPCGIWGLVGVMLKKESHDDSDHKKLAA